MSTLTVEQHPVHEAMDAQVAAHMANDMVNVARSLFALVQPAAWSAAGPAELNAPAPAASEAPALAAQPISVPVPAPAVVPIAIPAISAIPAPALEPVAAEPVVLAGREAVHVPSYAAAPRTMAMLSEISFLDD